ncbi:MAG: discoidin domain-containing protein [Myxococcales bacterium]
MLRRGFSSAAVAFGALCFCLLHCLWTAPARAQGISSAPAGGGACTTDNLLAGKRPSQLQDVRGEAGLITDGSVAPEGAQWDAPVGVVLETGASSVTYDLGQPTPITGLYLQADANDTYKVQGSPDGTPGSFKLVVEIENASDRGHGLRGRSVKIPAMTVRYLRVGEGVGDGFFSIAEFAVFCQVPSPFPPAMRQVQAPLAPVVKRPWYKLDWWEDHASARTEMGIALFALLLLAWGYWSEKTGKDVAVSASVPKLVAFFSLAIHAALAVVLIYLTTWVPTWLALLVFYLSCEFTLLVTPVSAGFVTPLRAIIARVRERRAPNVTTLKPPALSVAATVRRQLLVLVGIVSFFAYWNFGAFHFGNYVHYWDSYHYYVGSKYFKELSFDLLYECSSIADSEEPSMRRKVELRKIMHLRTNVLGGTAEILANPDHCKKHFTPERWKMFKKDIEYFRNRHGVKRWEEVTTDHGYNATPVWTILGQALANLAPASDAQMWFLTRIDPMLILGMIAMIWWAFGWQVLCVGLAVFATNFPSRFYWTGGSYLRWDWLFHMTAGVCLIKKGKPIFGGYLVAYSALLRVFPGFMFLGPIFIVIQQLLDQTKGRKWWQRLPPTELPAMLRKVERSHLMVILGAALAVATLVPVSLVTSNGVEGYRTFVQNSKKHTSTPLTNYMGWRTVVTYKEKEAGRFLRTDRLEDPWKDWKDARLRTFHHRKWAYIAGILGFLVLLYRAVRGMTAWEATALSSMMIAVVPELTCYYYSFLIVMALLWHTRREVGLALMAVTAATGFIDWAPTQFLPRVFPFSYLQMPTWLDEQYTWMSVATLLGIGYILYEYGFVPKSEPVAVAAPAGGEDDAPVRRKSRKSSKKAETGTKAPSPRRKKR